MVPIGMLLAGITLAAPVKSAHPKPAACSIAGNFGGTVGRSGQVKMTNRGSAKKGSFSIVITLPYGRTTSLRGSYTAERDRLKMTNTFSAPASVDGCIGMASTYALTWSPDCKTVTFHKVADACPGRIHDANGNSLTRQ